MNNNMINTLAGIYTVSLATGALMAAMSAARMPNQRDFSGPGTDTFEFSVEPSGSGSPGSLLMTNGATLSTSQDSLNTTASVTRPSALTPGGTQFKSFSAVA